MAEEFNLSIYNDVYDMSFNQETEEIHIELKEGYYPLSNNVDLSNYYNKPQSDSRYKSINYVPSWGSIGGDIENQTDLIQKFGNYYIKTETYNKNEVNSLISNIDVDVDLSNYYNKPQSDARYKPISYTPNWSEVSGKPTAFTPLAHTHTISEVINLQSTLDNKVDKVSGKKLSTEDYTTYEKNKLSGIQEGAEVNVNADWNATSGDAQILNLPSTFTPSLHTHSISEVDNLQNTLDGKEQKISTGTTSQYWRGDKTWQTLDKNAVGLSNVDNTSDVNKPISNATQTALGSKLDKGTYTGTASDLFLNDQNILQSLQNEQSERYYADQGLENSKQKKLTVILITGNTTLSEIHNGAMLHITNSCTITFAANLGKDFNFVEKAFGSIIVQHVAASGVSLNSDSGLILKNGAMGSVYAPSNDNFILTGTYTTS